MPADFIIKTGDMIKFTFLPPVAIIPMVAAPVPLIGTSKVLCEMVPMCLQGDELPPTLLSPMPYMTATHSIPGMGTLSVQILPTNMTLPAMTLNGGKPILIKGTPFVAKFQVTVPAQMPAAPSPIPDPVPMKVGQAEFVTTTMLEKAG